MAESTTAKEPVDIDAQPDHTGPDPVSPGFNTMASQLSNMMADFNADQARTNISDLPKAMTPLEREPKPEPKKTVADEKPKTEAKVETPNVAALDEDAIPENLTVKSSERFKALVAQRKEVEKAKSEIEKTLKDRETELAALRETTKNLAVSPEYQTQLDAIKKERDAYQAKLREVGLEKDPQFDAYFKGNISKEVNAAKSIVGLEKSVELEKLMALPDSEFRTERLTALSEGLNPLAAHKLIASVERVDRLNAERSEALSNNAEILTKMEQAKAMQRDAQTRESNFKRELLMKSELSKAAQHLDSFKRIDGNEEHNAAVAQREGIVSSFFQGKMSETDLAKMPIWAAHGMHLSKVVPALLEQVARLNKQLGEYQSANPKVASSGGQANGKSGAPKNFTDAYMELTRG